MRNSRTAQEHVQLHWCAMIRTVRNVLVSVFMAVLVGSILAACGSAGKSAHAGSAATAASSTPGSGSSDAGGESVPSGTVALIGDTAIGDATLSRWMSSMVGGDFYESTGVVAPSGLVSDPPNYGACVAGLKTLPAAARTSAAQLADRCKELHEKIEEQALTYLIEAQWAIDYSAEAGVHVTPEEVGREFKRLKAMNFPKEAELQQYLSDRRWTLATELFLIKRDLLSGKLIAKLGPGRVGQFGREAIKRWTAKTICRPGYIVEQCDSYTPSTGSTASVDVLIEELTGR